MNEFGKETLDIKELELEELSGSYDIKEIGVKEVANGAGMSEVRAAAAGDEQNRRLLEILGPVFGSVLFIGVVALVIFMVKRRNRNKNIETNSTISDPTIAADDVKKLTNELTSVVGKLDECRKNMSKLKEAVIACEEAQQAIEPKIKNVQSIMTDLNAITIVDDKGALEELSVNLEQKLNALNKLNLEDVGDKDLSNLGDAAQALKDNFSTLNNALVETEIKPNSQVSDVADQMENLNWNIKKYEESGNEKLDQLVQQFGEYKNFLSEIYGSVEENDIKVSIEGNPVSVGGLTTGLNSKQTAFSDEINGAMTKVNELEQNIKQKLAAIENKGNESPKSGTFSSYEEDKNEEKQAQIKGLKESLEELETNVENFNKAVKNDNIADKVTKMKEELTGVKMSELSVNLDDLSAVDGLLEQAKKAFEQANENIVKIEEEYRTNVAGATKQVKEELEEYINQLKKISESGLQGDIDTFEARATALNEKFTSIGKALSIDIDISEEVGAKKADVKAQYKANINSIIESVKRQVDADVLLKGIEEREESRAQIKETHQNLDDLKVAADEKIEDIMKLAENIGSTMNDDANEKLKNLKELKAEAEANIKTMNEKVAEIEDLRAKHKKAIDDLQLSAKKELAAACKQRIEEFIQENNGDIDVDELPKSDFEKLFNTVKTLFGGAFDYDENLNLDASQKNNLGEVINEIEQFLEEEKELDSLGIDEEEINGMEENLQKQVAETRAAIAMEAKKVLQKELEEKKAEETHSPEEKKQEEPPIVEPSKQEEIQENEENIEENSQFEENNKENPSPEADQKEEKPENFSSEGANKESPLSEEARVPVLQIPLSLLVSLRHQIISSTPDHVRYNVSVFGPSCSSFVEKEKEIDAVLNKAHSICEGFNLGAAETLTSENLDNLINYINAQFSNVTEEELNEYTNLNNAIKEQCEAIKHGQQGLSNLLQLVTFDILDTEFNSDENFGVVFKELKRESNELAANIDKLKNLKDKLSKSLGVDFKNAENCKLMPNRHIDLFTSVLYNGDIVCESGII